MTIAKRYCGTLEITISYSDDNSAYDVEITERNDDARFAPLEGIKLSPHCQRTLAVDSDEAFDRVADAALSFAANEDEIIFAFAEVDDEGATIRREA